ncbi:hypothetical protein ES703_117788 [subsurface metagenome]
MYTDWSPTMMQLGGRACLFPGKYGQDYFTDLVGLKSNLYGAQLMCRDIARSTLLRASLIMVSMELPAFGTSDMGLDPDGAWTLTDPLGTTLKLDKFDNLVVT